MTTISSVAILRSGGGFQGVNCPIKGCEWTEADLDGIVAAHAATREALFVPLKLTHDDDDKEGAAGWIENLVRVGDRLYADFVSVSDRVVNLIRERRYRTRSVELARNLKVGGQRYPLVLVGVALLGANLPAVDGLGDIMLSHRHHDCACPDPLEPTADEMHIAAQMGVTREQIIEQKRRDRADEIEGERLAMRFNEEFRGGIWK